MLLRFTNMKSVQFSDLVIMFVEFNTFQVETSKKRVDKWADAGGQALSKD